MINIEPGNGRAALEAVEQMFGPSSAPKQIIPVIKELESLLECPESSEVSENITMLAEKIQLYITVAQCFKHKDLAIPPQHLERIKKAVHLFDQKKSFTGSHWTLSQICIQSGNKDLFNLVQECLQHGASVVNVIKSYMRDGLYKQALELAKKENMFNQKELTELWKNFLFEEDLNLCFSADDLIGPFVDLKLHIIESLKESLSDQKMLTAVVDLLNWFDRYFVYCIETHKIDRFEAISLFNKLIENNKPPTLTSDVCFLLLNLYKKLPGDLGIFIEKRYGADFLREIELLRERVYALEKEKGFLSGLIKVKNNIALQLKALDIIRSEDLQKIISKIESREAKANAWIATLQQEPDKTINTFDKLKYSSKFDWNWNGDESNELLDGMDFCLNDPEKKDVAHLACVRYGEKFIGDVLNETDVAKSLYQLLLEKNVVQFSPFSQNCWWSHSTEKHVGLLISCLNAVCLDIGFSDLILEKDKSSLNKTIKRILVSFAWISVLSKSRDSEKIDQIFNALKDQEQLFPILFPVAVDKHAMLCQLDRNILTYYNTGSGCNLQYRNDSTGRFQTYLEINFNPDSIDTIRTIFQQNSVDKIYEVLVSIGIREPASILEIDYESPQLNGSCSAQCIMSFFRHQILSSIEGSSEHRLGVYKELKTRVLSTLLSTHKGIFDDEGFHSSLKPLLEDKEKELDYEKDLLAASKDVEFFQGMMRVLKIEVSGDISTPHARYALVRKALRSKVYQSTEFPPLESSKETDFLRPFIELLWNEKKQAEKELDLLIEQGINAQSEKKCKLWAQIGAWWAKYTLEKIASSLA